jgi:Domain of unknown function (DUF4410)
MSTKALTQRAVWFSMLAITCVGCEGGSTNVKHGITGGVTVQHLQEAGPQPTMAPRVVYVEDFRLDHEDVTVDEGLRGRLGLGPSPLQRLRGDDPAHKAQKFVDAMSEGLVQYLEEADFPAQRLASGAELPKDGWLIRGVFTEVNEGNRVQRAVIGFGRGATSMEVQVWASDLARNPEAPFIIFGTIKDPSHMPGAVVTLNPFVAAAKFVLEKNASERDVKRTAKEIVLEMLKYRDKFKERAELSGSPRHEHTSLRLAESGFTRNGANFFLY